MLLALVDGDEEAAEHIGAAEKTRFEVALGEAHGGGKALIGDLELEAADRDTEALQELLQKQLAYAHYWDALDPDDPSQRLWQRYGAFGDYRVLIVTTSERRRENLVAALGGQEGWDIMALTTLERLESQHPLFDPIWWNQQGRERALMRVPYD